MSGDTCLSTSLTGKNRGLRPGSFRFLNKLATLCLIGLITAWVTGD